MRHSTPSLAVLAYNEIPENRRIRVIAAVGRSYIWLMEAEMKINATRQAACAPLLPRCGRSRGRMP